MEVVETRYPFDNAIDFFSGGYGFGIAGFHLTVAFLVVIIGGILTLRQHKQTVVGAMSMLYFALQPFNNPAFTLGGIPLADFCGLYVALVAISLFFISGIRVNRFILAFLSFTFLAALHGAVVWTLDQTFSEQADITARYVIIARTAILPIVCAWIYTKQDRRWYFLTLIRTITGFTIAICVVYLIQLAVFFSGTLPYGTFSGAGLTTTVAFGGVSIERGHLSRFMAPLLGPLFIHCYINHKYWPVALYAIIMVINFSASGLSFVVTQLLIASIIFWDRLRPALFSWQGIVMVILLGSFIISFAGVYGTIIDKIYRLAIVGDESDGGGRSINLMLQYLGSFPSGIGYSGSTFRTAPGMPEINMGLYAFITQMSLFALIYIAILLAAILTLFYRFHNGSVVSRMLLVGALALPLVFSSDILWFGPLWWLPIFFLTSYPNLFSKTSTSAWREVASR